MRSSSTEPALQDDGSRKPGRSSSMDLSRLSSDFYLILFGRTFNIPLAPGATVRSYLIIVDFSALFAIFAISRALPFLLWRTIHYLCFFLPHSPPIQVSPLTSYLPPLLVSSSMYSLVSNVSSIYSLVEEEKKRGRVHATLCDGPRSRFSTSSYLVLPVLLVHLCGHHPYN